MSLGGTALAREFCKDLMVGELSSGKGVII